jgi:hypothetical protein
MALFPYWAFGDACVAKTTTSSQIECAVDRALN